MFTKILSLVKLLSLKQNILLKILAKYPKNYKRKSGKIDRYKTWSIRLEVSMTDKDVIEYIQKVLNVGTVTSRKPHHTSMGIRMQWRWRCTHRQAYKVCSLFYPYSIVKKEKHKSINKYIKYKKYIY